LGLALRNTFKFADYELGQRAVSSFLKALRQQAAKQVR
jgi:hypothetical protein